MKVMKQSDGEYLELYGGRRGKGYTNFLADLLGDYKLNGKVLDIGCSLGFFLEALDKRGYDTYGMDISEFAISEAKKITRAQLHVQSADEKFPYPDDFFDAITMFDMIEHIPNCKYTLKEAHRVLKPEGYVFIITSNSDSLLKKILGKKWHWYRDPTHVHLFSPNSLEESLISSRFATVAIKTFFCFYVAGDTNKYLRPFRVVNMALFVPKFGDSILAISKKSRIACANGINAFKALIHRNFLPSR